MHHDTWGDKQYAEGVSARWLHDQNDRKGTLGVRAALALWLLVAGLTGRVQAQGGSSGVRGRVTDVGGQDIAGAVVLLTESNGQTLTGKTDGNGQFVFDSVLAGAYVIEVSATGFADGVERGQVGAAGMTEAPNLALRVAARADVEVTTSRDEVLDAEVKVEETQRLFGAIPNFFVAYDWQAPPLKAKQKFALSYRQTFDPITVMLNEISAGAQEATNTLPGYGKGGNGFVKRAAANQANTAIGTFTGAVLFPVIFKQDPRYFYMGPTRTVTRRFFYALSTAFICRGDNGKWQPNYSSVLGDLATGAAANAFAEGPDRNGWHTVIEGGLLGAAFDGVGNVVQEFLVQEADAALAELPGELMAGLAAGNRAFEVVSGCLSG